MKRTKQKTGGRTSSTSSFGGFGAAKGKEPTWADAVTDKPDDAFVPHSMTKHFESGTLISHIVFGKGLVLSVDGAKIEVLFQDGKKKLAHSLS
ncbi:MAG: hypothetical protein MUC50_09830 [Myxococcota bacterium]|nr:hypothetical protein [Myxococcota bacterium]